MRASFGPDWEADLPLWGISWRNPPLSLDLLRALCAWQDEFDEMGTAPWPPQRWEAFVGAGRGLADRVADELGPSVPFDRSWADDRSGDGG